MARECRRQGPRALASARSGGQAGRLGVRAPPVRHAAMTFANSSTLKGLASLAGRGRGKG